jgi:cell division protein ZapA
MAQVTITVNGRPYTVGCEDGQETHVVELADILDQNVSEVAREVGQLGETRLLVMGALMLADEVADLRARLADTQSQAARVQSDHARGEIRAVQALEAAAKSIEALAATAAG